MVSASLIFSGFIATLKHNSLACAITYDAVYSTALMIPNTGSTVLARCR
jgi:hypothetical protein